MMFSGVTSRTIVYILSRLPRGGLAVVSGVRGGDVWMKNVVAGPPRCRGRLVNDLICPLPPLKIITKVILELLVFLVVTFDFSSTFSIFVELWRVLGVFGMILRTCRASERCLAVQ